MKWLDFSLDDAITQEILADAEGIGKEQIALMIKFFEIVKPKLDAWIKCGGTLGTFAEMVDGKIATMGVDWVEKMLAKLQEKIDQIG
jgi:hypothetical protein